MAMKNSSTNTDLQCNLPKLKESNGKPVLDSSDLALSFGKRHDNVLRKIQALDCSRNFHQLNFELMIKGVEIGKGAERESKYYQMTRDGFTYLAMGFTGKKAAQFKESYIKAFNKMEKELLTKKQATSIFQSHNQTLTPIRYHGLNIVVAQHNNQTWVDFRSVVNAANLDYYSQARKAELEIVDLGKTEGKLALISMDNLEKWLEGIRTDKIQVSKINMVARIKFGIHPFLTAKIAELSQQTPLPTLAEPEFKDSEPRSIPIIMEEVNEFYPEWVVVNRKALSGDVEFIADTLMETQSKIRQHINPLIAMLSLGDIEDEKAIDDFWKQRKAEAFQRLQKATA